MSVTIEHVRALNDPQRAYKWRVTLPNVNDGGFLKSTRTPFRGQSPGLNGEPLNKYIPSQAKSIQNGINSFQSWKKDPLSLSFNPSFQVHEINNLPFFNIQREGFYEAGKMNYYPGIQTLPPFTIVFYQDASSNIPDYIVNWKRKVMNEDGTKNLPSQYKHPINVKLLDGLNRVTLDITLEGCFPTLTLGYELTNQSQNLKLIQEFSADRVIYNPVENTNSEPLGKQNIAQKLENNIKDVVDLRDRANFSLGKVTNRRIPNIGL